MKKSNLLHKIRNYGNVISNIRCHLEKYIAAHGIKTLVLGVSGGIDSALVAALAAPIKSAELVGISLPSGSNKIEEVERASLICDCFCKAKKTVYIDPAHEALMALAAKDNEDTVGRIASGNIKARTRMILLYDIAQRTRGMVLGTDNLTEYLLGFWTLHGDVGDYSPIQFLWKSEVYEMTRYLIEKECGTTERAAALTACVDAVPTDGLGITNSDLDQLGAGCYEEVDKILKAHVSDKCPKKMMDHPIMKRHVRSEFKRNNPLNISRAILLK